MLIYNRNKGPIIFAKFLVFTKRSMFSTNVNGTNWSLTQKLTWCCSQRNWWFRSPYQTKIFPTIKIF